MTFTRRPFVGPALLLAIASAACGSSTSPRDKALDGEWTTGHACLALGLDLTWTSGTLNGSGTYRTDVGPTTCTSSTKLRASGLGTATLSATRRAAAALDGTMTFDAGERATFTGTLVQSSGGAYIDAVVVTSDGVSNPVRIYEGLIP